MKTLLLSRRLHYVAAGIERNTSFRTQRMCLSRFHSTVADESSLFTISPAEGSAAHVHSSLPNGIISYARGWAWQQFLLSRRLAYRRLSAEEQAEVSQQPNGAMIDADTVLLLEHEPVYTLGRGANENHLIFLQEEEHSAIREKLSRKNRGPDSARLTIDRRLLEDNLLDRPGAEAVDLLAMIASPVLAPRNVPIFRVERGGEVTFHGPGQLVCYPMLDLQGEPYKQDLHWFLRMVEEVVILTLKNYGITGCRDEINTGVWVGGNKVAAVGVSSSRWISTHGFALNVCPDLSYFDTSVIFPCGIDGRGVTSIAEILREQGDPVVPTVDEVALVVLESIQNIFRIQLKIGETLR